jgi:hypothetical protein
LNAGTDHPFARLSEEQDYSAGELANSFPVPDKYQKLQANGQQLHCLSYLGNWWGEAPPRFDDRFVAGYTRQILASGGMFTWDVPIGRDGRIGDVFRAQLASLDRNPAT